jgi:uncharacterized protein (DUF2141 family)
MDLYLKYAAPVFYNNQGFPEADVVRATTATSEVAVLTRNTVPNLTPGFYIVGAYNADENWGSHFRVSAATMTDAIPPPNVAALAARTTGALALSGALGAAVLADTEYSVDVPAGSAGLRLTVTTELDAQVYIRQGSPIAFSKGWPLADYSFKTRDRKTFDITTASATPLKAGRYYVWIANASDQGGTASLSWTAF